MKCLESQKLRALQKGRQAKLGFSLPLPLPPDCWFPEPYGHYFLLWGWRSAQRSRVPGHPQHIPSLPQPSAAGQGVADLGGKGVWEVPSIA